MKEKVGIITFHASHNCGSFLQSYAIENLIRNEFNKDVEIIDFSNEGQKNIYRPFLKNNSIKSFIKNLLFLPYKKRIENVYNCYTKFINENLTLSQDKYSKIEELYNIEKNYDLFIAGSDQIWNITCPDADEAYFLPFISNKKKIAYAPSFGAKDLRKVTNSNEELEKYKKYLLDFDYISCREKNGKKWIEGLINKNVELVLDPTLVVNPSVYSKIEEKSGIEGNYIFYYSPKYNNNVTKIVEKFAKENNLTVVVWNPKQWIIRGFNIKGFKTTYNQNPGIYLDLIKNAKYVFTTSFHGAIFSSIYRKKFWVPKIEGMQGDDDRVYTLLSQLNLEDRFLEMNNYNLEMLKNDIDYSQYEKKLADLVSKSKAYLEGALKDD